MAFVSSSIHFCRGSIARHGAGSKRPRFVSLRVAAKPRDLLASRWLPGCASHTSDRWVITTQHNVYHNWLVVWNVLCIFPYIGHNDPN